MKTTIHHTPRALSKHLRRMRSRVQLQALQAVLHENTATLPKRIAPEALQKARLDTVMKLAALCGYDLRLAKGESGLKPAGRIGPLFAAEDKPGDVPKKAARRPDHTKRPTGRKKPLTNV